MRPGANLVVLRQTGQNNNREWEAEQLARKRRQKNLEDAHDKRAAEEDERENMEGEDAVRHHQYMFAPSSELVQSADVRMRYCHAGMDRFSI